jgi:PAS domain S-box-containing protein
MASSPLEKSTIEADAGMRAAVERFDWAATPLGPREQWPAILLFSVDLCLAAPVPTLLYWGSDLRMVFNDAWAEATGPASASALGQPAAQVLASIWDIVGPQLAEVRDTGEGLAVSEQMLPALRDGELQETYWSYSLSPIQDDTGAVAGILNQGAEVTRAILAERRLSFQIRLADRLRGLTDPGEIKQAAAALLGEHLGVDRVGFTEVDEAGDAILTVGEWRRGEEIGSIEGVAGRLSALPAAAISYLKAGEMLVMDDVSVFAGAATQADADLGARLGVRAVITAPLVREGRLRAMLFVHQASTRRWRRAEAAIVRDVGERSWAAVERAQAEQYLRESEDHYRHTVELNPQVAWTALPDGQLNRVSKRWHDWTGTTGLGETWAGGLHPDDRERTFAVWGNCVATGEVYDIEHRVKMLDGSYRWARSRAYPRHESGGDICLWYGTTEDIHERKLAEERRQLLINELNHRVKNTLATVQAIAFQTLKGDVPLDEARARFEARLMALSRAHNLLTERNWEGALLDQVIRDALDFLPAERFKLAGEPVWMGPRASLALALALHELSTNAVKYGALSGESGLVSIRWWASEDRLALEWKESGGPAVAEPSGSGFGTRLIERGLASDLGGSASLHFEADGVRCLIDASFDAIRARENAHG